MHYLALATDYDGTIHTTVSSTTPRSPRRSGFGGSTRKPILVTGRELPDLARTLPRMDLFDLIVAENRALLYVPASHEEHTLASPPPPRFIERYTDVTPPRTMTPGGRPSGVTIYTRWCYLTDTGNPPLSRTPISTSAPTTPLFARRRIAISSTTALIAGPIGSRHAEAIAYSPIDAT
jgi:hypothetical protein